MFTNKDCEVCQLVHKEYPKGYRRLEMRYIIYPWPGEPPQELNHMYRPETTLAEFETYMAHQLNVRSPNASSAQGDLIMAVAAEMAQQLVEGGRAGNRCCRTIGRRYARSARRDGSRESPPCRAGPASFCCAGRHRR